MILVLVANLVYFMCRNTFLRLHLPLVTVHVRRLPHKHQSSSSFQLVLKIASKESVRRLVDIERPRHEVRPHITHHISAHHAHVSRTVLIFFHFVCFRLGTMAVCDVLKSFEAESHPVPRPGDKRRQREGVRKAHGVLGGSQGCRQF